MEGIYEKLLTVQHELKAPKGQYNSFGKYKYRSAEDILEAVKPILHREGLVLVIADDVLQFGERLFIKAVAKLSDGKGFVEVQAFAEIATEKKGMDVSQITGTASSYARKYALNGLFLIDDTKDADTDEYQRIKQGTIGATKAKALETALTEANVDMAELLKMYTVSSLKELTEEQHLDIVRKLNKR